MGLDRDDTIVRRRLRQKLEFLTEETAETAAPSDAELQTFLCSSISTPSRRAAPGVPAYLPEPRPARRRRQRRGRQLLTQLTTERRRNGPDRLVIPSCCRRVCVGVPQRSRGSSATRSPRSFSTWSWAAGRDPSSRRTGAPRVCPRAHGRSHTRPGRGAGGGAREWLAARRKAVNEQFYQRLRARYTVVVEQPQAASDPRTNGSGTAR